MKKSLSAILFSVTAAITCSTASASTMCPDGSYVSGTRCNLTPNGTYVGSGNGHNSMTICPDGSYVSGNRCNLTPSGGYIGGSSSRNMNLCPDGSYVSGNCKLTLSGHYVGE